MNTNEIMEDTHDNRDNLPVLTEIVRPESPVHRRPGSGVVNAQLAIIASDPRVESDPRGYDPYNSAPPVPIDKETFS